MVNCFHKHGEHNGVCAEFLKERLEGGEKMRLILIVKQGTETLKEFPGRLDVGHLQIGEIEAIPELEQALERLLGYRFHINEMVELKRKEAKPDDKN